MTLEKKRVMFVDDDNDLIRLLFGWFSARGFIVYDVLYGDALAALEELAKLKEGEKIVLLSDLNMRETTGPELIGCAKRLARFKGINLIPAIMTDHPGPHNFKYPVFQKERGLQAMKKFVGDLWLK